MLDIRSSRRPASRRSRTFQAAARRVESVVNRWEARRGIYITTRMVSPNHLRDPKWCPSASVPDRPGGRGVNVMGGERLRTPKPSVVGAGTGTLLAEGTGAGRDVKGRKSLVVTGAMRRDQTNRFMDGWLKHRHLGGSAAGCSTSSIVPKMSRCLGLQSLAPGRAQELALESHQG